MVKRFQPLRARMGLGRITAGNTSSISTSRGSFSAADTTRSVRAQLNALVDEYRRWAEHMDEQSQDVLFEALKPTFAKSQVFVPLDTGKLKASGYLEKRRFRGNPVVEIGYARGGIPNYAVVVHENQEFHHKPPTQAKFLERALLEDAAAIQAAIAKGYRTASGV